MKTKTFSRSWKKCRPGCRERQDLQELKYLCSGRPWEPRRQEIGIDASGTVTSEQFIAEVCAPSSSPRALDHALGSG